MGKFCEGQFEKISPVCTPAYRQKSQYHIHYMRLRVNLRLLIVFTFIWPLQAERLIDSPRIAQRFVSSLELERIPDLGIAGEKEIWTSAISLLSSRKGDHVSHNLLLCSFLIGFGLNAFVALGVKQNKPWSWVVIIDEEIKFWDGVTGQRFNHVALDPDNLGVPGRDGHLSNF